MSITDIETKQLVLIDYLQNYINNENWKFKAEYSTNDNDNRVVIVQEQEGQKIVFFDENTAPMFNYYNIVIYGLTIRENKNLSLLLGNLIGTNNIHEYNGVKWQIMFQQFSNPQTLEYMDIRRVGYSMTFKTVINKIEEE